MYSQLEVERTYRDCSLSGGDTAMVLLVGDGLRVDHRARNIVGVRG